MKLLFDENLSFRLCSLLADLFPDSDQVRNLGLDQSDDRTIWRYAGSSGFVLVTLDSDFADIAALLGPPPKVIWLRCGNQTNQTIEGILRNHFQTIAAFEVDTTANCLELL